MKPAPSDPLPYQTEVDGLRAVAVLSVILFHIDPAWLRGGFVGVDIFFVISGYLITGILVREMQDHRFSMLRFYERRVRRILPALWVLLLVCVPVSWRLMLPEDAQAMAKSAAWSVVAMANVYFWRDVSNDYFSPEAAQMPLLHLWSLGVEEQFYLFWPLVLLLLFRWRPARAVGAVSVVSLAVVVASTLLGEVLLSMQASRFAYYMVPTRAGELASGSWLAVALPALVARPPRPRLATSLGLSGWLLIAASLCLLDESQPFPGLRALMPALGAMALIASGRLAPGGFWLLPLRWRPACWLGLCSYSAYLWHWPVLAWWRYLYGEPSATASGALLAVILVLGYASYRWIEAPTRHTRWPASVTWTRLALLPAMLVGMMALAIARGAPWGLDLYDSTEKRELARLDDDVRPAHRLPWVCQRQRLAAGTLDDPQCLLGPVDAPVRALLYGDSHAAQFAPMFKLAAELQGVRVRTIALGSCAALPGSLAAVVPEHRVGECEAGMHDVLAATGDFPLLILGGAWADYAHRAGPTLWLRLEASLRELTRQGHRVWLLPRVPQLLGYDARCAAKRARVGTLLVCPTVFPQADPADDTNQHLAALANRIPGVRFLPLHTALCRTAVCPATDLEGHFIYADGSHLSAHGSEQLAAKLLAAHRLPDLNQP